MKKRSLFANSVFAVVSQAWSMVLALAVTPYVYHSLGAEQYGLFSLVFVIANYLAIVDCGFGWGIIKFVAEYAAAKDTEKMGRVIGVSVFMSLAIGLVLAAGITVLAPWLAGSVFTVPQANVQMVTIGIVLAGGICIVNLLSNVYAGVLKGLERFDIALGLRSLFMTVQMAGYVLLLHAGYGLLSLWIMMLLGMVGCISMYCYYIKRLLGNVSIFPRFDSSCLRQVLSFSVFGFGTRLLTMPYFYLDKLFIAALLPAAALAYYVIPFNLAQRIGGVGGMVVSVLFPSASARAGDREQLRAFYRRVVPVTYSVIIPLTVVAITMGPVFLGYWIGPAFASAASLPLTLVVIGFGVITLGSVDGTFMEGIGRPGIRTAIYCCLAIVSLPLCYVLTGRFGIVGTAATICLSFCAGGLLEVVLHHALITKSWWYFGKIAPNASVLTVLGLVGGWAARSLASGMWSTMGTGLGLFLLLAVTGMRIFQSGRQFAEDVRRARSIVQGALRRARFQAASILQRTA